MPDQPTCSVVVPVYNSEATLTPLIERLAAVLPTVTSQFEVILVNDGSRDRSWDVASSITETYSWVHGINFMRNYGQHNALLAGIRAARYELVITIDDDLQHPPEEISKLLDKLAEGYDVVYGTPIQRRDKLWRDLASRVTRLALAASMGFETARHASAFRIFRTELRRAFADYHSPDMILDVLLTWGTTRFGSVTVEHQPRQVGKSNYTLLKLLNHTLNMMTGFSTLPLRIASLTGFVFTIFGFLLLLIVMGAYVIEGSSVPGFPFLASVITIFAGVQLFGIGIIGEYLGRIHFRSMHRPSSVIRNTIGFNSISQGDVQK